MMANGKYNLSLCMSTIFGRIGDLRLRLDDSRTQTRRWTSSFIVHEIAIIISPLPHYREKFEINRFDQWIA